MRTILFAALVLAPAPALAQDWSGFSIGLGVEGSAATISGTTEPATNARITGSLGYDMAIGPVVAGVRAEAGIGLLETPVTVNGVNATWSLGPTVAFTGRAGFALGAFMPYVIGGVLYGTGTTSAATTGASAGVTAGAGLEVQVFEPLTLRGEARWTGREVPELSAMMPPGGKVDLNEISLSLGLVARF